MNCDREFIINTCYLSTRKFCSKKCYSNNIKISGAMKGKNNPFWNKTHSSDVVEKIRKSNIGRTAWNKGLKGYKSGKEHYNWKGDKAGYHAIHKWISKVKGKSDICSKCGSHQHVDWSNISFEYKRDEKDWQKLCRKCHQEYDRKNGWGNAKYKYEEINSK